MLQQSTQQQANKQLERPKRFDIFLHAIKTFKLIGALLTERRIPVIRKLLFLGSVGALVVVLFFPDLINEVVLSTVLPVLGTVLGVPLDAGFDWVAFALVITSLLRFFPADMVAEHYNNIFH